MDRTPLLDLETANEADWVLCPSETDPVQSSQENDSTVEESKTYLSHPPVPAVGASLHDTYLLLTHTELSPEMTTRSGKRRRTHPAFLDRKKARTAVYDLFLKGT